MAPELAHRRSRVRIAGLAAALAATLALSLAYIGQPASALTAARGTAIHAPSAPADAVRSLRRPSEVPAQAPPTPAPAVAPSLPATPVRAAVHHAAPPRAPAAPASYRNRLISADGSLNTGVGYYGDCSGHTPLIRSSAAIDGCVGGRTYFVGHNPGVFSALMHFGVGAIITWYDGGGVAHRLRIVAVRQWYHSAGVPGPVGGATAQFQTCITADGSLERILDAAPA